MTSTDFGRPPTVPREGYANWTLRALITRHKRFSLGAGVVVGLVVGLLVVTMLGPGAGTVTDKTTCSGWASANRAKQRAYASLYVSEHGALTSGATDPASVQASIDKGCTQAFDNDVSDSITAYQAINNQY
jgi:Tfp pilus assembly protein PilX